MVYKNLYIYIMITRKQHFEFRAGLEQMFSRQISSFQNKGIFACIAALLFFILSYVSDMQHPRLSTLSLSLCFLFLGLSIISLFKIMNKDEELFKLKVLIGDAWLGQKESIEDVLAKPEFQQFFPRRDVNAEDYVGTDHGSK